MIMATMADVRCTPQFVETLRRLGMDAIRINSAHVDAPTFRRMVQIIRTVDPSLKILMDTKGPEVRTTALPFNMQIAKGQNITFRPGNGASTHRYINILIPSLTSFLKVGQKMLIDDGTLAFEVMRLYANGSISARALTPGVLGSRKTVAFPGAQLPPLPPVSDRDREYIALACEMGLDMIAHSFVRTPADVEAVRELISGSDIRLYAKVECREALDNLDAICSAADGLLTARGDLGTSIPLWEIPEAQLRVVRAAQYQGKPTILATQILHTMISNPQPTRAELSDIALAAMEGYDCLLLCGETAQGQFPQQCVSIMNRTLQSICNSNSIF